MRVARTCLLAALVYGFVAAGCATQFYGDPKFPGGPRGCYQRCEQAGLEMQSYVFVGEYSTGCVCGLRKKLDGAAASDAAQTDAAAASSAAAVGVVLQMREAERQRAQASAHAGMVHPAPAPVVH